jgi:hypothetical protein
VEEISKRRFLAGDVTLFAARNPIHMSFSQALWLFPLAVTIHFLEEATGGFPEWAKRHASEQYTNAHWKKVHGIGWAFALIATMFVWRFLNRWMTLGFVALMLGAMAWNAVFHIVASLWSREVCPGMYSAVLLFPPLLFFLGNTAIQETLVRPQEFMVSLVIAGAIHALDVSIMVFFWPKDSG